MQEQRQWAVVLGCSAGVGRAIAAQVAVAPGYNLFGAHRGNWPEGADELCAEVQRAGGQAAMFVGDAGTLQGVQAAADQLLEVAGPRSVKLFVHSLANASLGRFLPGGEGRYRQFIPRNFEKTFNGMAHSFPWWAAALVERDLLAPNARLWGLTNPIVASIVNNFGLITAAKAALEMYIKHLALEMGPMGHRVNLLDFGTVATRASEVGFGDHWERFTGLCTNAIPAGRLVTAEEVGSLIALLCGDAAQWFNGATLDYTGGQARNLLDAAIYTDFEPGGGELP